MRRPTGTVAVKLTMKKTTRRIESLELSNLRRCLEQGSRKLSEISRALGVNKGNLAAWLVRLKELGFTRKIQLGSSIRSCKWGLTSKHLSRETYKEALANLRNTVFEELDNYEFPDTISIDMVMHDIFSDLNEKRSVVSGLFRDYAKRNFIEVGYDFDLEVKLYKRKPEDYIAERKPKANAKVKTTVVSTADSYYVDLNVKMTERQLVDYIAGNRIPIDFESSTNGILECTTKKNSVHSTKTVAAANFGDSMLKEFSVDILKKTKKGNFSIDGIIPMQLSFDFKSRT